MLYIYLIITLIYTANVSILFHVIFKTLSVYKTIIYLKINGMFSYIYMLNAPVLVQGL